MHTFYCQKPLTTICTKKRAVFRPQNICFRILNGKYTERVQIPAKAFLSPTLGNSCHTYYFAARQFRISRRSYFVNNRQFTEFLDRYFHIPLPIVTKHELGLPFPPLEASHKMWCKSVHNVQLSWSQTDTHTRTQTNAGENIFPRFRGDNYEQT